MDLGDEPVGEFGATPVHVLGGDCADGPNVGVLVGTPGTGVVQTDEKLVFALVLVPVFELILGFERCPERVSNLGIDERPLEEGQIVAFERPQRDSLAVGDSRAGHGSFEAEAEHKFSASPVR